MDSAGAGGRWLEFISRSWIATSIRNFAAVAMYPPFNGNKCTPDANSASRRNRLETIEKARHRRTCWGVEYDARAQTLAFAS